MQGGWQAVQKGDAKGGGWRRWKRERARVGEEAVADRATCGGFFGLAIGVGRSQIGHARAAGLAGCGGCAENKATAGWSAGVTAGACGLSQARPREAEKRGGRRWQGLRAGKHCSSSFFFFVLCAGGPGIGGECAAAALDVLWRAVGVRSGSAVDERRRGG